MNFHQGREGLCSERVSISCQLGTKETFDINKYLVYWKEVPFKHMKIKWFSLANKNSFSCG